MDYKNEYIALETRALRLKDRSVAIKGRFIEGFVNGEVTEDLVIEVINNSTLDVYKKGNNTCVVKCILPNKHMIIETYSFINEEYNEAFGADICIRRIYDKVEELLNFLYLTGMNGFKPKEKMTDEEAMEHIVNQALEFAVEDILEAEYGEDYEFLKDTTMFKKQKQKAIAGLGKLKKDLTDIAKGEELSLEELVELIVALYLATNK